jgi:hypothetical protein
MIPALYQKQEKGEMTPLFFKKNSNILNRLLVAQNTRCIKIPDSNWVGII